MKRIALTRLPLVAMMLGLAANSEKTNAKPIKINHARTQMLLHNHDMRFASDATAGALFHTKGNKRVKRFRGKRLRYAKKYAHQ